MHLVLPNDFFPSGFLTQTLYIPFFSPIRATCPAHLVLLDFPAQKYWVSSTDH